MDVRNPHLALLALSAALFFLTPRALASEQVSLPLFEEAGKKWGLSQPIIYGAEGDDRYILLTTGTGVAAFDYDNDGRVDLFFVNGSRLDGFNGARHPVSRFYQNRGDRFEDRTAQAGVGGTGWGQGVCVGDYDNDGWTDLYVTYYGHNLLYRNRGDGSFQELGRRAGVAGEKPRWGAGCTFIDYDRDGDLDLYVANYVAYREIDAVLKVEQEKCSWKGMPVVCGPMGLPKDSNALYRNNEDGTFTDVSKESGVTAAEGYHCFQPTTADFDDDGWPDVYVSCDSSPNILYRNNADGSFTDIGFLSGTALSGHGDEQAGMGVAPADFDGDRRTDLLITNFSDDTPTLYKNLGDWVFSDVTFRAGLGRYRNYLGWGAIFLDWDHDGWQDLFMVNGHVYTKVEEYGLGSYRQRKLLYRNRGDGSFENVSSRGGEEIQRPTASRGAAAEDFDGDGDLDLVVVNINEPPSLLLNQSSTGSWVILKLVGTSSNKSAVGARVLLRNGEQVQKREVRSSTSYFSSNGLRLHFGLGNAQTIESLEILWPSGSVSRFSNLTPNQVLVIREGEALPVGE